jgi:ankyrin repeat protein
MKLAAMVTAIFLAGCEPTSAIHGAAESGDPRRVDTLLARGADIDLSSPVHGSALSVAARRGDIPMIRHLLDKGADVNAGSPLSVAAWYGSEDVARLLIGKGADLNSGMPDSPLFATADRNRLSMISLLLSAGADPNGGAAGKTSVIFRFTRGSTFESPGHPA